MSVIYTEGFETDGNGTRYTTSVPEFSDGFYDFFIRTDGSNVGPDYVVSGTSGAYMFAAQDTNGDGQPTTLTFQIDNIDIAGVTDLGFSGLFAEDDDGANQDWDADALVYVEARIDDGVWVKVLQFASQGVTNTEPGLDTDFDGVADGPALTSAFTEFTAAIAGTGAELDLRITIENLESGDEDIAFDDLTITGTPAATEVDVLNETFDDASKFTTSTGFFSDEAVSSGFDYFGISDGAGGGDFGTGDPAQTNVKAYTGADGSFLTGMDLDGEGATTPFTVTWSGLDISGLTDLRFEGDFAEFFDSPGDIDPADYIKITATIDGVTQDVLWFSAADLSGTTSNGIFRQDTDFDGTGDGTALFDAFSSFMADIAGTGSVLDLTLEVSVDSGDEDFAVDNFRVIGTSGATIEPAIVVKSGDGISVDEDLTIIDTFTVEFSTVPTDPVEITMSAPDGQSLVSTDGVFFSNTVTIVPTDTLPTTIYVRAANDSIDENSPHFGEITFATASADPDYNELAINPLSVEIEDNEITKIHDIQGAGDASAMDGEVVTVEAVVTGLVTNNAGVVTGFFLQEEDADADADAATSEGIFVFANNPSVSVGDKVRVTATVDEFNGLTELTNVSEISTLDTGVQLPTVTVINIGLDADYEAVEGMRVELVSGGTDPLTVIENFNLDRYGEVVVSEGIQTQPTQIYDAQTQAAEVDALADENAANRLLIEDNITGQNPDTIVLVDSGDGTPLEAGDPITEDGPTLRLGSELNSVTGIMNYAFGDYRLQVDAPLEVVEGTGERPDAVPDVGGDLQVASFNVLNFFTTLDQTGAGTGPNGDLDPRGADTAEEYTRQLDKLVTAILELDAEVIGLQELENNGFGPGSAIAALVYALNAALGADVYSFVDPGTDFVGTDAITTGVIYKHDVVTLTGVAVLNYEESSADETWAIVDEIQAITGTDPVQDFDRNRPTIAATFEDNDGSEFTVAVNHYKSKGDSGLYDLLEDAIAAGVSAELILALIQDPNFDQGDGQGFWNQVRTDAALELAEWLQTNPTGAGSTDNLVLLGDLNSYAMEDPVQALIDAGFTDLAQAIIGTSAYSYVFDGQQGTLDYALASGGLLDNVTGAAEWHINADEPDLLNYDNSFKDPAFYNNDPFAVSDHDPMLIGLELDDPTMTVSYEFTSNLRGCHDRIKYFEEGEKQNISWIDGPQEAINIHWDGLYIDGFDGIRGKEWLTINENGLGIYSKFGDTRGNGTLRQREANMLDDEESIVFHLTDKEHVGDGLEVEFEFGKVKGAGEVTLIFRDDGVKVDKVHLTIVDDMISYDLDGNTSFDEVEIEVCEGTKVQISSIDIERLIPNDQFDFLGS